MLPVTVNGILSQGFSVIIENLNITFNKDLWTFLDQLKNFGHMAETGYINMDNSLLKTFNHTNRKEKETEGLNSAA